MTTINGKACVANGRNLYVDTDFNNLDFWTKQADKYSGLAVMQTTGSWNGLSQYVKVKTGEVYIFSVYARYTSGTGNSNIYWLLNDDPESGHARANTSSTSKWVNLSENWQRISATTTITADGYIRPRIERTDNNDNTLQIAGIKLERGTLPTPWTPVPVDKVFSDGRQVYGRNLYLDTKSFVNPGVWSNYACWSITAESFNGFKVLESTGLWSGLSQTVNVKKGEHYTFSLYAKRADSAGGSTHIYWTDNNSKVSLSSTAQSFNLTDDWQRIAMTVEITGDGYIRPRIERDTDDGYQILIAGLKLESGNLLTAWSPAPEDVM